MFKPNATLPPNVEVQTLYDRQTIDGATTSLQFFQPNPTGKETDNFYLNNPLTGDKYQVLLGFGLEFMAQTIKSSANVDPVAIINNLKDAVVKISTNGGRDIALLTPLSQYMNFQQTKVVIAESFSAQEDKTIQATLESAKPRKLDNLFYFDKNERWKFEVKFATGTFPAAADFTDGRLGIEAVVKLASMDDAQLGEYKRRSLQVLGGHAYTR